MKANERKIPFISFQKLFRIGTFQWVTADSNKKITPAISGCARRSEASFRRRSPSPRWKPVNGRVQSGDGQWYSTDFHFCQDKFDFLLATIPSKVGKSLSDYLPSVGQLKSAGSFQVGAAKRLAIA
jgi:hypothetical protein